MNRVKVCDICLANDNKLTMGVWSFGYPGYKIQLCNAHNSGDTHNLVLSIAEKYPGYNVPEMHPRDRAKHAYTIVGMQAEHAYNLMLEEQIQAARLMKSAKKGAKR